MYGKSWACPPAVGEVEECKARCLSYNKALLISTITEVSDIANIEETLATRTPHEAITRQVHEMMKQQTSASMVLSTEACAHCEKCTYPDAPCRFPEKLFPALEGFGIFVNELVDLAGIPYKAGENTVSYFGMLCYNEAI